MIFRVTKGNSILYTFDVPKEQKQENRTPMVAFVCVLETGGIMLTKIHRVCDSFGAKRYKLPTNKDTMFEKIKEIEDTLTETKQLHLMAGKKYKE